VFKYFSRFSKKSLATAIIILLLFSFSSITQAQYTFPTTSVGTGNIGLEGTVASDPPTQAATIVTPASGAVFKELPVTVSGWCPSNLLVKIFKNNVFGGAVMCSSNSYSIQIDLFSGRNDIVARVYDALNQGGPDSNTVTITFDDSAAQPNVAARINLTSNYASRGANPEELLTWPIIISGGTAPYAISVDWGDNSGADVYTVVVAGEFTIKHTYQQSGVYRVLIKGSDKNGALAYLQLVGVGNGEVNLATSTSESKSCDGNSVIMWWPAILAIVIAIASFWLGKRYELTHIKHKMQHGEPPFDS
jgi:hypothetical protein